MKVKLKKAEKIRVLNSEDIYFVMQRVLQRQHKIKKPEAYWWSVCLEEDNTILLIELLSTKGWQLDLVNARKIYKLPVQKDAPKMILVHTHADGNIQPTTADKSLTKRLREAGKIVDVILHDHLIINLDEYYSFRDKGLIR